MTELFHLAKSETLPLTRQFVQEFLRHPASPTERPRSEKRIKHLQDKATDRLLVPFNWALADYKGTTYRMNGRHSSEVLSGLDGHFPNDLTVHLDTYEVASDDGLATLFRQFDDRGSGRTAGDVAGAYQGLEEGLRDVARPPAKLAVESITWWRKTVERSPFLTGDDRYELFHETQLQDFIAWMPTLFDGRKVPELANEAIVAAMFATFDANRNEAKAFWADVANGGDEYRDGAPGRVLSEWLHRLIVADPAQKLGKVTKPERYQGCIYAWNAFRRDEPSLREIKYATAKGWARVLT